MTHTLHRMGDKESLKDDYVLLRMWSREIDRGLDAHKPLSKIGAVKSPKPIFPKFLRRNKNMKLAIGSLYRVVAKFFERHPKLQLLILRVPTFPGVFGRLERTLLSLLLPSLKVFNNKADLASFLKLLKKINIGASVVVSGLYSEVFDCLKKVGIHPHTVEFSLGIFGKKTLLPKEDLLQTTTMCGHHLISPKLVKKLYSEVKRGRVTYEEAAQEMAKQCVCGAFNTKRAVRLMKAACATAGGV